MLKPSLFKFLFFCCLLFPFISLAQQRDWRDMLTDADANFYEVQASFYAEFPDANYTRGSGWKKFKRWELYYMDRIDEEGNLPDRGQFLREVRGYLNQNQASRYAAGTGDWEEVGPIAKPINGTGQPNGNGRINTVTFHPTDANRIYVGSPSNGMWETTDGGNTWTKRVDGDVRLGVSSIVIHPTNPNLMYIGTGDRDAGDAPGYGVWRSLDGGLTMTPHNTGMGNVTVNEIIMHPSNANIMVATSSNGNSYRTTDAGANWVSTSIGEDCEDLAMHPTDPNIMYAAGANVYRSTDNGVSWTQIAAASGFNPSGHNRTALAVSPNSPNTVYALSSGGSGFKGMYRSTDSGLTWTLQSNSPNLSGYEFDGSDTESQSFYDHVLIADPANANTVIFGGVNVWKSTDAGVTWSLSSHWVGSGGAPAVHADHHALAYSPLNGNIYNGNDGGLYVSPDIGSTWFERSSGLAIAQVYKIGVAQTEQDLVINGYQDNGTSIYYSDKGWNTEIGGDGFECQIDPTDDNYMYGSLYYGDVRRSTNNGLNFSNIAKNGVGGITESGAFSAPFTLDPNNASTMYLGMKNVWRSTNLKAGSPTWSQVSTWSSSNLKDVAVSPANSNYMMASSNNNLRRTTNASAVTPTWTNIYSNLPATGLVKDIAYDPNNVNTVMVAQSNTVHRSTDNGTTWVDYSGTLPNISVNCVVFDKDSPVEAMYLGMDVGVYYRDNTMSDWTLYKTGLPNIEITDLEIYSSGADCQSTLYASSYGGGMWKTDLKDPGNIAPVACFKLSGTQLCQTDEVTLTDISSFTPTSWAWTISPNTFSFINGTTAGSQHPEVTFNNSGTYTIQLTATNGTGSNSKSESFVITSVTAEALPFANDFESPTTDFTIINPGGTSLWVETTAASANGVGTSALVIDNYSNNEQGTEDYYTADVADLNMAISATLSFDVAYGPYSSSLKDYLRVEVSIDCGDSWVILYNKTDLDLGTIGGYTTNSFTPTSAQWRNEELDLTAYVGQNLQVRFVNVNGYSNRLFIDNINFTAVEGGGGGNCQGDPTSGDDDMDGICNDIDPDYVGGGVCSGDNIAEDGVEYSGTGTTVVRSNQIISTNNSVVVPLAKKVEYRAGQSIFLNPGFQAIEGSDFLGRLENCTPAIQPEEGTSALTESGGTNSSLSDLDLNNSVVSNDEDGQTTEVALDELSEEERDIKNNGFQRLYLFPNPTSNRATIGYTLYNDTPVSIEVYDVNGRKVAHPVQSTLQAAGEYQVEVRTAKFLGGVYFVLLRTEDGLISKRLMVVR